MISIRAHFEGGGGGQPENPRPWLGAAFRIGCLGLVFYVVVAALVRLVLR